MVLYDADLDLLDKDECSPLCIAIREQKRAAASNLILAGADVNNGGGIFGSSLHLAVVKSDLKLLKLMIAKGADVDVVN